MGATEAYQSGGWPAVAIALAALVIAYLVQDNRTLRKRIDEFVDADREAHKETQKRDAEELKELRRQRDQEARR